MVKEGLLLLDSPGQVHQPHCLKKVANGDSHISSLILWAGAQEDIEMKVRPYFTHAPTREHTLMQRGFRLLSVLTLQTNYSK